MLPIFIYGGTLDQRLALSKTYLQNRQLLFELDALSSTENLKEIQGLKHALSLKSGNDQLSVLILEAQKLSIPAQNALLKVFEEHDPNIQIIITGHNQSAILATLLSRAQEVPIRPESDQNLEDGKQILEKVFNSDLNITIGLAKKWATDEPDQKLKHLLAIFQSHTHQNPTIQRAKAIEIILESYQDLFTYIPKDFVLGHLFLRLQSLRRA